MNRLRIRALSTCVAGLTATLWLGWGLIESGAARTQARVKGGGIHAEKLKRPGLPNLGRVNEMLYRGGQPTDQGYRELQKLAIIVVVNLRNEKELIATERAQVEGLGMRYASIPWSGYKDPDNRQVAEFLTTLRGLAGQKVYVHCQRGAERTGVMLAAWRMAAEAWSPEQALAEMESFGFRGWWFGHLKRYVKDFPRQMATDPSFRLPDAAASAPPQS